MRARDAHRSTGGHIETVEYDGKREKEKQIEKGQNENQSLLSRIFVRMRGVTSDRE